MQRFLRVSLAATALSVLVACDSASPGIGSIDAGGSKAGAGTGGAPSGPPSASRGALDAVLPGLYGLDELGASAHGNSVEVSAPTSCGPVLDVLRAGQWAIDVFVRPKKNGGSVYAATMRRGNRLGVLALYNGPDNCTGTITHDSSAALRLAGTLNTQGSARYVPFMCSLAKDDISDSSNQQRINFVGVYVTPSAGTFVLNIGVPVNAGRHALDVSGDGDAVMVAKVAAGPSGLAAAASAFKAVFDPTQAPQGSNPFPGLDLHQLFGTEGDAEGTLDVTSMHPFAATLSASNLHPVLGDSGRASVDAQLHCDS